MPTAITRSENASPEARPPIGRLSPHSRWPLLAAAQFIRSNPRAWLSASVPTVIALVLATLGTVEAIRTVSPWLASALTPAGDDWTLVWQAVRWLSAALAIYLALAVSLLATPTLSSPALEHLVRLAEEELNAPARPVQGVWFEFLCGLRAQLFALSVTLPGSAALWLMGWLLPWLSPLIVLLQSALIGCAVAWNLLDYPLTLRGIGFAQRWRVARRHPGTLLAFGLPFAAISWIPILGVLLLPIGVVAATEVLWRKLSLDPELAQTLAACRPTLTGASKNKAV